MEVRDGKCGLQDGHARPPEERRKTSGLVVAGKRHLDPPAARTRALSRVGGLPNDSPLLSPSLGEETSTAGKDYLPTIRPFSQGSSHPMAGCERTADSTTLPQFRAVPTPELFLELAEVFIVTALALNFFLCLILLLLLPLQALIPSTVNILCAHMSPSQSQCPKKPDL